MALDVRHSKVRRHDVLRGLAAFIDRQHRQIALMAFALSTLAPSYSTTPQAMRAIKVRSVAIIAPCLDDHRRLIAAGKSQRWDVVKWAVTINMALAAASIAVKQQHVSAGAGSFPCSPLVSLSLLFFMRKSLPNDGDPQR